MVAVFSFCENTDYVFILEFGVVCFGSRLGCDTLGDRRGPGQRFEVAQFSINVASAVPGQLAG